MPMENPNIRVKKLYELRRTTVAGEESLDDLKSGTLWNSIFNYSVDKLDHLGRYGGGGNYSPAKRVLMKYLEMGEVFHIAKHALQ